MNIPRAIEALKEIEILTEDAVAIGTDEDFITQAVTQDPDVCAAFQIILADLRARMPRCA